MRNISLQYLKVLQFKLIKSNRDKKNNIQLYGIKRRLDLDDIYNIKLKDSIKKNDFSFPFTAAKVDNDYWLIDGYLRLNQVSKFTGYPTVVIEAKDFSDVLELYFQCQSRYGSPTIDDYNRIIKENNFSGVIRNYEIGCKIPSIDIMNMSEEEILEYSRNTTYQVL